MSGRYEGLVGFFDEHRSRVEDLYPSELRFLPWLARTSASVLDVGCASGGFLDIWRALRPAISYTGIDVSPALVESARMRHPGVEFGVGDAAEGLALTDGAAETVQALGWLHWEPRYPSALAELWRVTGSRLFFDVRLRSGVDDVIGSQALDGGGSTPYVVAGWDAFAARLLALSPATILGYGYVGPPAPSAVDVPENVWLATFVLARGEGPTAVCLDAPFGWPAELEAGVRRYPAARLEQLAPREHVVGGGSE